MVDNWELPTSFPNYHGLTDKLEELAQTLPSYDNALSTIGAIPDAVDALNGAPAPDNLLLSSCQAIGLTLGLGATARMLPNWAPLAQQTAARLKDRKGQETNWLG